MRTPESWLEEMFSRGNWVTADVVTLRAIQKDALLEAAEIADRFGARSLRRASPIEIRDAILKRAKDLEKQSTTPEIG